MKHYILDAFNIIHKHREWKKSLLRSPNDALQRLLLALSLYATRYTAYRFTVVVDGYNEYPLSTTPNIRVRFSGRERNADVCIKEMIAAEPGRKTTLVVVSSDTEVYNYARIHAAEAINSEDFLRLYLQPTTATSAGSKTPLHSPAKEKPSGVSKKQMNELKNLFGEDLDEDWMDTL